MISDKEYITNIQFKPEGIGSLMQYILALYFYNKENSKDNKNSKEFIYTPIIGFEHGIHEGKSQKEWDDYLNTFIVTYLLPSNINFESTYNTRNNIVQKFVDKRYLDSIIKKKPYLLNELKSNFHSKKYSGNYFDNNKLNIAIHVRVLNSVDNDSSIKRELYSRNNFMDQYYRNCIYNLLNILNSNNLSVYTGIDIHIYSQKTSFDHYKDIVPSNTTLIVHNGIMIYYQIFIICVMLIYL